MTAPLVSVVVPVYNGAKYLRDACDSVLAQKHCPLELIVVDDGSTDDSPQIIRSFADLIVSIRQENGGVSRARNTGIRIAKGEYVAFLDQDDWWLPDKLSRQIARFRADDSVGLVHTGILQYCSESRSFVKGIYENILSDPLQGWCYDRLLLGNGIINSSVMVRKATLATSGFFDEGMAGNTIQDYDLWLRIARNFRLNYVAESLTIVRVHREQSTWNRLAMLTAEVQLMEKILSSNDIQQSRLLKVRMAALLENLGLSYLAAEEKVAARRAFAKALRLQPSCRRSMLWVAALFPNCCIDYLRGAHAKFRPCITSPAE